MGKKCDLCDGVARMYCESDQASLCWGCDGKVHGANFLVAKHTRCLLCSACQSLTPWIATGLRLAPTFSVCVSCVALKTTGGGMTTNRILSGNPGQEKNSFDHEEDRLRDDDGNGNGAESYDDDEDEDEDDEYSDEDEDEDDVDDDEEADNQVVPWAAAAQPPPVMISSSFNGGGGELVTKRRTRDWSDDENGCSSAQESNYSRPLKRTLKDEPTAVINSIIRLKGRENIERCR